MNSDRMKRLHTRLKPLTWLEAAAGVGMLLALLLGPKDVANPLVLMMAGLSAAFNATRNVALYRLMDEYERSLMLRSIAAAFIFLMLSIFVTAMVGASSAAEAISPLLLMVLFLGSWGVFGATRSVLQRRESRE